MCVLQINVLGFIFLSIPFIPLSHFNHLTLFTNHSRSSTGEGIFQFGTQESVLITNTLGTVIELLADQRRQRPLVSFH